MAVHTMVALGASLALGLGMILVIISDTVRYIIPNSLNLAILILWLLAIFFLPSSPFMAAGAAGIVLAFCLLLYAVGFMGGGDVKLLVVLTLWTGWGMATLDFLLLTALAGAILVFIVLPLRIFVAPLLFKANPTRNIPRVLTKGQPVPYGIAIAAGFLWLLYTHGVPMLG